MKCSDTVDIHWITKIFGSFIAIIRYTFIQGTGSWHGDLRVCLCLFNVSAK